MKGNAIVELFHVQIVIVIWNSFFSLSIVKNMFAAKLFKLPVNILRTVRRRKQSFVALYFIKCLCCTNIFSQLKIPLYSMLC